jgi:hypothetical protein
MLTVSALLGVSGGLVLAYSANPFLEMLRAAIAAQSMTVDSVVREHGDIVVFRGFDEQLEKAAARTAHRVTLGSLLLVACFVVQLLPLWIE